MGSRIRVFVVSAAAVLLIGASAAAQDGVVVRGVVRDPAGAPLHGAVVTVAAPDWSIVRVSATDLWGEYEVPGLDPGQEYTVEVSHGAFRKAKLRIRADGEPLPVQLKPKRKKLCLFGRR